MTAEPVDPQVAEFPRAESALIERFAALPSANIADAMERFGALDSHIQAVWDGAQVAGSALTVWTRAGDNLAIDQALEIAQPGDVIVVNSYGYEQRALLGDIIGAQARKRGVAGFVLDGACRDRDGLAEIGMPVFARALTPAGPYKSGPGRIGLTVACGGVAVSPGDVVVGDADGVVVVPLADAQTVADAAEAKRDTEARWRTEIEAGER